jgi:hypothetical protein
MSTITPSPVWLDELAEFFPVELSNGAATNCFYHNIYPRKLDIIVAKRNTFQEIFVK